MLNITEDLMGSDSRRRWFGASDQVALASILTREHGYTGSVPGTASSKKTLPSTTKIRTAFNPVMQSIEKSTPVSRKSNPPSNSTDTLDVLLLSCPLYNGSGVRVRWAQVVFESSQDLMICFEPLRSVNDTVW